MRVRVSQDLLDDYSFRHSNLASFTHAYRFLTVSYQSNDPTPQRPKRRQMTKYIDSSVPVTEAMRMKVYSKSVQNGDIVYQCPVTGYTFYKFVKPNNGGTFAVAKGWAAHFGLKEKFIRIRRNS